MCLLVHVSQNYACYNDEGQGFFSPSPPPPQHLFSNMAIQCKLKKGNERKRQSSPVRHRREKTYGAVYVLRDVIIPPSSMNASFFFSFSFPSVCVCVCQLFSLSFFESFELLVLRGRYGIAVNDCKTLAEGSCHKLCFRFSRVCGV